MEHTASVVVESIEQLLEVDAQARDYARTLVRIGF